MLKKITIGLDSYSNDVDVLIIDTILEDNIEIIKKFLFVKDERSMDCYRAFTKETYFDQVDWRTYYYEVEDVEVIKI